MSPRKSRSYLHMYTHKPTITAIIPLHPPTVTENDTHLLLGYDEGGHLNNVVRLRIFHGVPQDVAFTKASVEEGRGGGKKGHRRGPTSG